MTENQLKEKIAKMTLEEKALQLTQYTGNDLIRDEENKTVTGDSQGRLLKPGQSWRMGTALNMAHAEGVQKVRKMRLEKGIEDPLVVMHDVIHGYYTNYPIPLAMAGSFDLDLAEECAEMAAIEAKYDGVDATFSPMVDLVRDARWGRVMESNGEDPYLNGEMGKAIIRGYHKGGIACCVKHFAGYGAVEAGMEYNYTNLSEHDMDEYFLRGYAACMEEKPEMVMSSFNALNGIPILGNKKLMVDKLRKEWGFDGVLISDYAAVAEMIDHGYCEDLKECAKVALDAKLDIEMCSPAYARHLEELLQEGKITEEQIDECVLRVLQLKDKLGMFENPNRFTDVEKRNEVKLCAKHRALARKAAEGSMVLLKNDGTLPLTADKKILLCGPNADDREIYGNWSCHSEDEFTITVKEGVDALLGRDTLYSKGCTYELFETDESQIPAAVEAAKNVDVIVACIGETSWHSGEAKSRVDITVPAVQVKLVQELKKVGKPIVLVVFGGRPLVLTEVEPLADAILYAWQAGNEAGNAVASLLYGKVNPSAKTAMSFPRSVGQCPLYYNHFLSGRPKLSDDAPADGFKCGYIDSVNAPLYPFGYGLSYTKFVYSDLKLDKAAMCDGETILASVKVKNTGDCAGKEVVQWYIHDRFGSCVRPVKELKHFEKICLEVGEEKTVSFEICEKDLAFFTASGEFKAEKGKFDLYVGGDSQNCLATELELV